jgi:glycosyltransferase involved in cell wall biosynthesis
MRIGQNPAKSIDHVAQPAAITVAVVNYIPFNSGYYSQSLKVLQASLGSLKRNTSETYDLMVFDNASCPEVRQFLLQAQKDGDIQYLVLSEKNVGKGGAWNFIFSAAPGETIAYADSDIYFFPGWLTAQTKVLDAFPNVGMVTGLPLWSPEEFSTSTIDWAERNPEVNLERGRFLTWEDYWRHSKSLGKDEGESRRHYLSRQDICLVYGEQRYFVGAGHFQFVARKKVLQSTLPIPSERPMGQVRALDIAMNAKGYLRLSTPQWWVQHLGNTLEGVQDIPDYRDQKLGQQHFSRKGGKLWAPFRKGVVWLHGKTFDLLYRN